MFCLEPTRLQAPVSLAVMWGIDARALRITWTIFLFGLLIAIVYYIRSTILLFSAAIFLAYMLSPIVALVEKFMPRRRNLALTIVYVSLVGLLVLIGFQLIPTLTGEATNLASRLPTLVRGGQFARFPLPRWLEPVRDQVMTAVNREASSFAASVVPFLQTASTRILSGIGEILPLILVPILAFFFLKDAREIRDSLLGAVEHRDNRSTAESIVEDIHQVLKNYIRALVLLSAGSFVAWAIFLSAMSYPYELLLAGLAGILEFIPVIGPAAALAIIVTVLLVTGSGGILWVIVFWACFRVVQDYVINPFLMSSGTELHPLLVLFGVLAGERLGGIPGMFFSVPVIAILKVVVNHLRRVYSRKNFAPA